MMSRGTTFSAYNDTIRSFAYLADDLIWPTLTTQAVAVIILNANFIFRCCSPPTFFFFVIQFVFSSRRLSGKGQGVIRVKWKKQVERRHE